MMRTRSLLCLVCALALLGGAVYAQAPNVAFDENGNGFAQGKPLPSGMGPDPGPGGLPLALWYQLPFQPVVGDLVLMDDTGAISDVVRFGEFHTVYFYSDIEDPGVPGDTDLADVGFPTANWPLTVYVPEQGVEGHDGAIYRPGQGMPGFSPEFPDTLVYKIVSDGVIPEPGSLFVLGVGLVAMAGSMIRRRAR